MDYYSILGVSPSASASEIRRAFRRLALEWHPDVNKDPGAADRFREISTAYQVLMDAGKRAEYDAARNAQTAHSAQSSGQASRREPGASQSAEVQQGARRRYFRRRVRAAADPSATWNYYDVLGVPHNATEETIVRAYQSLYQDFYSGRSHDPGTADILREIGEALEVLKDPDRRLEYDSLPPDRQPPGRPNPPPRRKAGCFMVILAIPLFVLSTLVSRIFKI